eukprot:scaffold39194_cov106-Phaeocystis_antarctica.AAC.3
MQRFEKITVACACAPCELSHFAFHHPGWHGVIFHIVVASLLASGRKLAQIGDRAPEEAGVGHARPGGDHVPPCLSDGLFHFPEALVRRVAPR